MALSIWYRVSVPPGHSTMDECRAAVLADKVSLGHSVAPGETYLVIDDSTGALMGDIEVPQMWTPPPDPGCEVL